MSIYRELLKHSAIYGLGQILARIASVLLLPLYTRCLTPADYGVIHVLDLTIGILSLVAAGGVAGTVNRFHFESKADGDRHRLWCTGLMMLLAISVPLVSVAWLARDSVAAVTLGSGIGAGPDYLSLALLTIVGNLVVQYQYMYLRVLKKSLVYLALTVGALLLQIALNILLIAVWSYGIYGFLIGGLVSAYLQSAILLFVLFRGRSFKVERDLFSRFWSYGYPLIFVSLSTLLMHQADRYLLRQILGDLTQVGLYGLAYQIVQGVNSLVIIPFGSVWHATKYEINDEPERVEIYENFFKGFSLGLSLVLLGVALFAGPIVTILASREFYPAARIIPTLCAGFFFFSLHEFYSIPAYVHKQTRTIARVAMVAAAGNIACNCALIPFLGVNGAAVSTIIGYALYSLYGHSRCRRFEKLSFPFRYVVLPVVLGAGLVLAARSLAPPDSSLGWSIAVAGATWLTAAAVVCLGPGRPFLRNGRAWLRGLPARKKVYA